MGGGGATRTMGRPVHGQHAGTVAHERLYWVHRGATQIPQPDGGVGVVVSGCHEEHGVARLPGNVGEAAAVLVAQGAPGLVGAQVPHGAGGHGACSQNVRHCSVPAQPGETERVNRRARRVRGTRERMCVGVGAYLETSTFF